MSRFHRGVISMILIGLVTLLHACSEPTGPFTGLPSEHFPSAGDAPTPVVAPLSLAPAFRVVGEGERTTFSLSATSAGGGTLPNPAVEWSSLDPIVATVSGEGAVVGTTAGVARIRARSGAAEDTALVAVVAGQGLLLTAFAEGAPELRARPGQTISVPVVLDLSRVSASGSLGAFQLELAFDPAVLEFVSAEPAVSGNALADLAAPGRVAFALATTAEQGKATFTLMNVTFRVRADARPGAGQRFTVTYPVQPVSTQLQRYDTPTTVGGSVVVAASTR